MSMELVILAPALVLLVLFVLWAGRGGRAGLVADLAAGEAAVVASLCCEDDPSAGDQREQVVADVLAARPGLDFLCVHGIEGAVQGGEYVDEAWLDNFEPEFQGAIRGVGAIGVRFECETDGAVAPLRGLFPNVSFYGQATEVIPIPPQPVLSITGQPGPEGQTIDLTGKTLTFLFELSAIASQDVNVYYKTNTLSPGETHAKNTDYTEISTELSATIAANSPSITVDIDITRDDIYERDETFELEWRIEPSNPCAANAPVLKDPVSSNAVIQCSNPSDTATYEKPVIPGTTTLNPDYWKAQPATGTIENDDPKPTLTVSSPSATEGSDVVFDVALNAATGLDVDFTYETKDDTTSGAVKATDDSSGCTVGSSGSCDYEARSHSLHSGTITADETNPPSATVNVPTGNDPDGEGDETFELEVKVTNGNAQPATESDIGTIIDDEPKIKINDVTSGEATSRMQFTVDIPNDDPSRTADVTVDYVTTASVPSQYHKATGGTSCANTPQPDYVSQTTPQTLTFSPGTSLLNVDVVVCDDSRDEPANEKFGIQLSNPSSNASILDGFGLGTITDNDSPPEVSVSVSPTSVEEGNPMEFKVELDAASGLAIQVDYAVTDGTASLTGRDYSIDSPHTTSGTLSFAPGDTEKIITVQALYDPNVETDEDLKVTLTNPQLATLKSGGDTATGIITDFKPATISIADQAALEGQPLIFTVTLSKAVNQPVTVDYDTAAQTATAGADYTAPTPGTLTIPANTTTATLSVQSLTDTLNEVYGETFFVNLSNPTPTLLVAFSDNQAVGTIQNVISRDLCINNAATVVEGQSLVFEVILGEYNTSVTPHVCAEKTSTETVTVNWSTKDGTGNTGAVAPGDYVATTNATLTFLPGETKKTLSVRTNNDLLYTEGTEKLFVDLISARNAVIRDKTGEGEITNVPPAQISVADPAPVDEGTDLAFIVSVANAPSAGNVTVTYTVSGLTATGPGTATGDDFDVKSQTDANGTVTLSSGQTTGSLTFSTSQTTATVTLTTKSGDAYEPDETVRLDLSGPSANAVLKDATAIGTIQQECVDPTNSSHTPPALSFRTGNLTGLSQTLGTAVEGVRIPFAVAIDAPFCPGSGGGYFMLRATDVSATSGTDYTAPVATQGYQIGDVSNPTPLKNDLLTTFYITTSDDQIDEPDETFTLEVNWLDTGTNKMENHYLNNISWVSTTGTITDNDALPNVRVADAAANEGNDVVFTVTMDRPQQPGRCSGLRHQRLCHHELRHCRHRLHPNPKHKHNQVDDQPRGCFGHGERAHHL